MCTLGMLVSTCAYLWNRKLTCAYLLNLWNDQPELHQRSCSPLGHVIFSRKKRKIVKRVQKWWCTVDALLDIFLKVSPKFEENVRNIFKNVQKIWCTFDALLMRFWKCIKIMHFWCTVTWSWCTFDALSKAHQKCIIILGFLQNLQKIWETYPNVHQKCIMVFHRNDKKRQKSWHDECVPSQWLMAFTHLTYHR